MDITVYLIIAAVFLGLGSWLVFVWAAKSGQFEDIEDVKHIIMRLEGEDKDEPRE